MTVWSEKKFTLRTIQTEYIQTADRNLSQTVLGVFLSRVGLNKHPNKIYSVQTHSKNLCSSVLRSRFTCPKRKILLHFLQFHTHPISKFTVKNTISEQYFKLNCFPTKQIIILKIIQRWVGSSKVGSQTDVSSKRQFITTSHHRKIQSSKIARRFIKKTVSSMKQPWRLRRTDQTPTIQKKFHNRTSILIKQVVLIQAPLKREQKQSNAFIEVNELVKSVNKIPKEIYRCN
eukprot:TRINITY_DN2655_c5_g1_i5.p1 TRINITY_DN2655_c5_g1~~TRINITY_DN2655_c5_g1_i5.p1  ORF type:complete len:231 (+),score=-5.98 TRINITY_DN2655_c5_g1_i5:604-1296(+)